MRKKLLTIQIIQTIFIIILLLVAILEKNGIMQREESFMPFYVISCLIYWFILDIVIAIIMHKNRGKEKRIFKVLLVLSVEILLVAIFCGSVDKTVDMLEFTKHCKETTATIYDFDKEVDWMPRSDDKEGAIARHKYWFEYYVDGARYSDRFDETYTTSSSTKATAMGSAERSKPTYKIGDEFTIYYNTENPEDWRRDILYFPDEVLNVFAFIIIGLRGFLLGKGIRDYRKQECLDVET